jgi:hypothetical protein
MHSGFSTPIWRQRWFSLHPHSQLQTRHSPISPLASPPPPKPDLGPAISRHTGSASQLTAGQIPSGMLAQQDPNQTCWYSKPGAKAKLAQGGGGWEDAANEDKRGSSFQTSSLAGNRPAAALHNLHHVCATAAAADTAAPQTRKAACPRHPSSQGGQSSSFPVPAAAQADFSAG